MSKASTKEQVYEIEILISKADLQAEKSVLVTDASAGRTANPKKLTRSEAANLISVINQSLKQRNLL